MKIALFTETFVPEVNGVVTILLGDRNLITILERAQRDRMRERTDV
jgi:hypothetical protein